MLEVEIFNYKTIKHQKFVIDGYTLLLGKNFIGKSAAMTAIVAALKNAEGDDFIRYGEKFAEVRLTGWGHSVIWHKEAGNNFYIIDGEPFKKIGRGKPPQPIFDMGLGPLEVSGEKVLLWYAEQLKVLFLVDRPKQNFTTDIIASVTKLDAIYKAVDLVKKDLAFSKATHRVRSTDLVQAREKLKAFDPLTRYLEEEPVMDALEGQCLSLEQEIQALKKFEEDIQEGSGAVRLLAPTKNLESIDSTSVQELVQELTILNDLSTRYTSSQKEADSLAPIQSIGPGLAEDVEFVESLQKELSQVNLLATEYALASKAHTQAETLIKSIPDLEWDVAAFENLIAEIALLQQLETDYDLALEEAKRVSALKQLGGLIDHQGTQDEVSEIQELNRLYENYRAAYQEALGAKALLKQVEEETAQIELLKSEFPECPTCGRAFNV